MTDAHKNFAVSTVATAPSPATSGTSLVVASGHGARFPATPFDATIWPTASQPDPSNAEIVRVTAISTDTLTITRSQESSSARTVVVGDQIAATITAKTLTDAESLVLICSSVLGSTQASFDTNTILGGNIPGTYNHLRVVLVGRSNDAAAALSANLTFNNDTGANYDFEARINKGAASDVNGNAGANIPVFAIAGAGATTGSPGTIVTDIPCYALTTFRKQMTWHAWYKNVTDGTPTTYTTVIGGGEWRNTSAITRLALTPSAGSFIAGSAFYLYGIV